MDIEEALLEVRNLKVFRPDGSLLLDVPELRLFAGQWLVVSGTSGSGKSTFLRVIAGLLAQRSGRREGGVRHLTWNGEIRLDGIRQLSGTIQDYRRRVTWIPQRPVLEPGPASASIESLAEYRYSGLPSPDEAKTRAGPLLTELGLDEDILSRNVAELSGGEASRVALARSLLLDRRLILLDEPGSALDGETSRIAANIVRRSTNATAVVIVSHDENWTLPGSRCATVDGATLKEYA